MDHWGSLLLALLFAALLVGYLFWRAWSLVVAAGSDIARIKRDVEGAGRRLVEARRNGWEFGGRYGPDYRCYRVTIQDDVQGRVVQNVAVAATMFTDPEVKIYGPDGYRLKRRFPGD